jgi:hypothetical protein
MVLENPFITRDHSHIGKAEIGRMTDNKKASLRKARFGKLAKTGPY